MPLLCREDPCLVDVVDPGKNGWKFTDEETFETALVKTYCNPIMERLDEILEIVREIREDIAYMKRHRNMLCGTPILEVSEVCDLLKISDRQLRRYCVSGQLTGFHFGRRLMFSAAEINRFVERIDTECRQRKELKNRIRNL